MGSITLEFTKTFLLTQGVRKPPEHSLGIGIHWPSTLSEDDKSVREAFEPISYHQMGTELTKLMSLSYSRLCVEHYEFDKK